MSYRDDLDAAHHRSDALEREVVALTQENRALEKRGRRRVDWRELTPPLLATLVTGAFTSLALWLGWSLVWPIAGGILMLVSLITLFATTSVTTPQGAIPVKLDLEIAGKPLRLLAVLKPSKVHAARQRFLEKFPANTALQIAETAGIVLEQLARERGGAELDEAAARTALDKLGLDIVSIWLGPA